MVRIEPDSENNLLKTSAIDTFQIRSISTAIFEKKIGSVSPSIISEIKTAVKTVIDTD